MEFGMVQKLFRLFERNRNLDRNEQIIHNLLFHFYIW